MKKRKPLLCAALSALLLTYLTVPVYAAKEDAVLQFDENGEFSVSNEGYYTVQVTTQSRKVIRIKLYVEE